MKTIAMVVILYGKSFAESKTLQSLIKFEKQLDRLLIVNNGPDILDVNNSFFMALSKKHKYVEFENQTQNKPLSWIYNEFINSIDVDYYVFFDDDTEIDYEFEKYLFQLTDIDVELPKIISIADKKQYYPILNGILILSDGIIRENGDLFSIGSGLIISNKIKKLFLNQSMEIFDSRFALYGVDFSFFRKLNKIRTDDFLISSQIVLNHSLSRTEGQISTWRSQERLYDEILSLKYYTSLAYLRLLKKITMQILRLNFRRAVKIFAIYMEGRHPRCNQTLRK